MTTSDLHRREEKERVTIKVWLKGANEVDPYPGASRKLFIYINIYIHLHQL